MNRILSTVLTLSFLFLVGCYSDQIDQRRPAVAAVRAIPGLDSPTEDWSRALAAQDLSFDERTLLAFAGRLVKDRFNEDPTLTRSVVERLVLRPELTAEGLRALDPLLLSMDYNSYECYELVAAYLDNPHVPMDVLEAYADQPWNDRLSKTGWELSPSARGAKHLAARRLLQRQRRGEKVERRTLTRVEEFVDNLVNNPVTIPEELEQDHPSEDWTVDGEYTFIRALDIASAPLESDEVPVASARLEVKEPFNSAADWRTRAQVDALVVEFGNSDDRASFLRSLIPAYRMTGDLPKHGYPIRPDVRKRLGFVVTTENSGERFVVRLKRRWPR